MDIIQKRLELIDFKLSLSPVFIINQIIDRAPLVFVAAGIISGIILQNIFSFSIYLWLLLLMLTASISFICAIKRREAADYAAAFAALFVAVCLGAIRLDCFNKPSANDIRNFVGEDKQLATIRGVIITEPYVNYNEEWVFSRYKFTDPSSSFYLKLREAETTDGWAKVTGTVRVQVQQPILDLKAGDYVQMYCWLDRFRPATNPGQFQLADYLARKNICIGAMVETRGAIELLVGGVKTLFARIRLRARQIATESLLGSRYAENQSDSMLKALVLGYRADIDSKTYEAFRKTGLLHFVCLSGMNFGILIGIIWWLCKAAGFMNRTRAFVCINAAALFLLVIPPNPPAFRAAVICFAFCAAFFFNRQPNSFNSLALAAVILLLIRPTNLFEADWQLSFATVLGILLFTDRIHFFLYEKITGLELFEKIPKDNACVKTATRGGQIFLEAFSVSLAAWLSSAGILLYHFYSFQYLTSLWTVLVSPLIALISVLGYLKLLLGLVLPFTSSILNTIMKPALDLLIWLVQLFGGLNISEISMGKVNGIFIVFFYGLIFFTAFTYLRKPFLKNAIFSISLIAILAPLTFSKWQRNQRDELIINCLDVGHGQAVLMQFPENEKILFDAGSQFTNDAGRRIIKPFLNYSGTRQIDSIVISHNDLDHINAIPEVIEGCNVRTIYANNDFFAADSNNPTKFLKDWFTKKQIAIRNINELKINKPVSIKTLWPDVSEDEYKFLSENDKSSVLLIEFAGRKILLCSDAEKAAQAEILKLNADLNADIIIAPHHGSANTQARTFLERLTPEIVICSCSKTEFENRNRLILNNCKVLYTGQIGSIQISIDKQGRIKEGRF